MGMFDTIILRCPDCGEGVIEEQTKEGPCRLERYELFEAPLSLLDGYNKRKFTCPECNHKFKITISGPTIQIWRIGIND